MNACAVSTPQKLTFCALTVAVLLAATSLS